MFWKQLFATKSLETLHAEAAGDNRLRRVLGPITLTSLGVGAIIGAGIFVMTGRAAAQRRRPGHHAVLRRRRPRLRSSPPSATPSSPSMAPVAGSAYTYAYATLGELFAWIIGWDLILEYAMACACVAASWSKYFNEFLDVCFVDWQVPAFLCQRPVLARRAPGSTCRPCSSSWLVTVDPGHRHPRERHHQRHPGRRQARRRAVRHRRRRASSSTPPTGPGPARPTASSRKTSTPSPTWRRRRSRRTRCRPPRPRSASTPSPPRFGLYERPQRSCTGDGREAARKTSSARSRRCTRKRPAAEAGGRGAHAAAHRRTARLELRRAEVEASCNRTWTPARFTTAERDAELEDCKKSLTKSAVPARTRTGRPGARPAASTRPSRTTC